MDYEKKYKDAFKKAREYKSKGYFLINSALESIFPELKESEDERIRKGIIQYLEQSQFGEEHYLIDDDIVRGYIVWLEKQKQEPKKVSIWKHWKDGIAGSGEGEQIFLIKHGNTYHLSSCLSFECDYIELSELDKLEVEKQGEQTHAWNGEDEAGFGYALWAIEQARSLVKDENDMGNLWYAERWLKSIKEKIKNE